MIILAKGIYLNRLLIIGTVGLIAAYLYFQNINIIWFGFICLTGFIIPLIYTKFINVGWLQRTYAYPILIVFYMFFAILFLGAKWGIHFTAFLPEFVDPISYQLMRFTQASNEQWLSLNFGLYYFGIPILMGLSLFAFFEIPVKLPTKKGLSL